jgi:hypothetical protein
MDIIAAHRDGLIEQLDLDVSALAGAEAIMRSVRWCFITVRSFARQSSLGAGGARRSLRVGPALSHWNAGWIAGAG